MNLGLTPLSGASSGLSLVRVLGTLSRTLGIVRQISPIYKEIKPIISKAPVFLERLGALRMNANNLKNLNFGNSTPMKSTNETDNIQKNNSGPVFFQWSTKNKKTIHKILPKVILKYYDFSFCSFSDIFFMFKQKVCDHGICSKNSKKEGKRNYGKYNQVV